MTDATPDDLRTAFGVALEATLASPPFAGSARRAALLRHLVQAELDGSGDRLKAYAIAVDVLGRREGFDPATDSIVRVEVGRLRDALALHNASLPADAARIDIPKGSYRPRLIRGTSPDQRPGATASPPPARRPGPRGLTGLALAAALAVLAGGAALLLPELRPGAADPVAGTAAGPGVAAEPFTGVRLVLDPFAPLGDDPTLGRIASLLGAELVADLSTYPWLSVLRLPDLPPDRLGEAFDARPAAAPDAILSGEVALEAQGLSARLRLAAYPGFEVIWAETVSVPLSVTGIEVAQARLAAAVADRIAARHGIAPDLARAKAATHSGARLADFLCVTGLYDYFDSASDAVHLAMRTCLEDVRRRYPAYGAAAAALAFVYMDEARQGRNPRPGADPWADAGAQVEAALLHAPLEQTTLLAALAYSADRPDRDAEAFRRHGDRLIRRFPRDPVALMTYASKLGPDFGRWDDALRLSDEAMALTSVVPAWFHFTRAYAAVLRGEDEEARRSALAILEPGSKSGNLLRLAAAARTGDGALLEESAGNLRRAGIGEVAGAESYIRNRRFAPDLEAALIEAVRRGYALLSGGGG